MSHFLPRLNDFHPHTTVLGFLPKKGHSSGPHNPLRPHPHSSAPIYSKITQEWSVSTVSSPSSPKFSPNVIRVALLFPPRHATAVFKVTDVCHLARCNGCILDLISLCLSAASDTASHSGTPHLLVSSCPPGCCLWLPVLVPSLSSPFSVETLQHSILSSFFFSTHSLLRYCHPLL